MHLTLSQTEHIHAVNKELELTQQMLNDYKKLLSEKLSDATRAISASMDALQKDSSKLTSRGIEHEKRISDCEAKLISLIEQNRILTTDTVP